MQCSRFRRHVPGVSRPVRACLSFDSKPGRIQSKHDWIFFVACHLAGTCINGRTEEEDHSTRLSVVRADRTINMNTTRYMHSPSEIGSEEGENESQRGITILCSLSSSQQNELERQSQSLSPPDPLLPNAADEFPSDILTNREGTGSEIVTVKSEASLSLTPSMVFPTNLHAPSQPSTLYDTRPQQRRHGPNSANGNGDPYKADTRRQNLCLIFVAIFASVFIGFTIGFFAGKTLSDTQHEKTISQYIEQFNAVIAVKDEQIYELVLQRENRALYWEMARAGTIAIASSLAQIVAGPLTDYFTADVDSK